MKRKINLLKRKMKKMKNSIIKKIVLEKFAYAKVKNNCWSLENNSKIL